MNNKKMFSLIEDYANMIFETRPATATVNEQVTALMTAYKFLTELGFRSVLKLAAEGLADPAADADSYMPPKEEVIEDIDLYLALAG